MRIVKKTRGGKYLYLVECDQGHLFNVNMFIDDTYHNIATDRAICEKCWTWAYYEDLLSAKVKLDALIHDGFQRGTDDVLLEEVERVYECRIDARPGRLAAA